MAFREFGKHHKGCGGVVVDGHGRLGPGERAYERLDVSVAAAARHVLDAVFECGIAARHIDHGVEGLLRQGAAADVGVQDNARGVYHGAKRGAGECARAAFGLVRGGVRGDVNVFASQQAFAHGLNARAHRIGYGGFGNACANGVAQFDEPYDLVDFGKRAHALIEALFGCHNSPSRHI